MQVAAVEKEHWLDLQIYNLLMESSKFDPNKWREKWLKSEFELGQMVWR